MEVDTQTPSKFKASMYMLASSCAALVMIMESSLGHDPKLGANLESSILIK